MKKRFYVVRKGRKPGIYQKWSDAEKQVKGFSGAEYKGFGFLSDAEEYLNKTRSANTPMREESISLQNKPKLGNPMKLESFYTGETPPWEFPEFIACIETIQQDVIDRLGLSENRIKR